jgi:hypothetical protein
MVLKEPDNRVTDVEVNGTGGTWFFKDDSVVAVEGTVMSHCDTRCQYVCDVINSGVEPLQKGLKVRRWASSLGHIVSTFGDGYQNIEDPENDFGANEKG